MTARRADRQALRYLGPVREPSQDIVIVEVIHAAIPRLDAKVIGVSLSNGRKGRNPKEGPQRN